MTNTAFWEQYIVNSFQFSAAKSRAQMMLLQKNVYDEKGVIKSFSKFKKDVSKIVDEFNQSWLRAEYDLAHSGSIHAEQWKRIWDDRDINPFAIYRTRGDGRVREEHANLNRIKFRIDSEIASTLYIPNGWNCRCFWETTDDDSNILSDSELKVYRDKDVSKDFQYNVGTDGIMPSERHSYFDVLPNANTANSTLFAGEGQRNNKTKLNTTYYNERAVKLATKDWGAKEDNDIVFQNREFLLNVFLTSETLKKIAKKNRGIENIKKTIEKPDEIYARWKDPKNQKVVLMNYFAHDSKNAYIVETKGGYIVDAYIRSHEDSKDMRKQGIKLMK